LEQDEIELTDRQMQRLSVIREVFEQQQFMYENRIHKVKNRIVSISQPYIRPIVRGKAKAPVEFGAKYDVSVDEKGHARLEKVSFDPYNESGVFIDAVERYKKRKGHYPKRILVDQIYRTKKNRAYCKEHGIEVEYDDRNDYTTMLNSGVLRRLNHAYWKKHNLDEYADGNIEYPKDLVDIPIREINRERNRSAWRLNKHEGD
jgi:hypothetical protein